MGPGIRSLGSVVILVVSNAQNDQHVLPVATELTRRGEAVAVVDPGQFPTSLCITVERSATSRQSVMIRGDEQLDLNNVSAIWYRRPEAFSLNQDLEPGVRKWLDLECDHLMRGLWATTDARLVNDPARIRDANSKLRQLRLAARLGFRVPDSMVTNDPERAREFCVERRNAVIVKALADPVINTDRGPGMIYTHRLTECDLDSLDAVRHGPTFLQEFVDKTADVRVTVFGDRVFGVAIDSTAVDAAKEDFRKVDPFHLSHTPIDLPDSIKHACVQLVAQLDLSFGAIDLLATADRGFVFLEINPNGQWFWLEQLTGLPMTGAMCDLLTGRPSATEQKPMPALQSELGEMKTLEIGTHVLPIPDDLRDWPSNEGDVALCATNVVINKSEEGFAVSVGDLES